MLYTKKPIDFNPKVVAAGCFVRFNNEILLLHRQDHRPEGNLWGLPAGKVDAGETPLQAICREIQEETGLTFTDKDVASLGIGYVRYENYDCLFHLFEVTVETKEGVQTDINEHKDFTWIEPKKAINTLPFIGDLDSCIHTFLGSS